MSSAQLMPADLVASQRDAFMERFLQFASGTFNMFSIYIGDRLGLYRALSESGPSTSAELAFSRCRMKINQPSLAASGCQKVMPNL
jgi:hypothetical protein